MGGYDKEDRMMINYEDEEPGFVEFERPRSKKVKKDEKNSSLPSSDSHPYGESEDEKIKNEDIERLEKFEKHEKKAG